MTYGYGSSVPKINYRVLDAATLISPTIDNYLGNALGLTGSGIFIMIVILP